MEKIQVTADPAADRARQMEELLDKMAEGFNAAFPTTTDLIQWLADANEVLFENAQGQHAKSAERLLWWFGWYLLPRLVKAKTKEKKMAAIVDIFRAVATDDRVNRGLPFLNYLTLDNDRGVEYTSEEWRKSKARASTLELISELGEEYEILWTLKQGEQRAEYQKARDEKIRLEAFQNFRKMVASHAIN